MKHQINISINLAVFPSDGVLVVDDQIGCREYIKYSGITSPIYNGNKIVKPGALHNVEVLAKDGYIKIGDIEIK